MAINKLSSKAAKLDFSNLPGVLPARPAADSVVDGQTLPVPKTAPGALMAYANDARSSLIKENESLREQAEAAVRLQGKLDDALSELGQWEGAKAAKLLDPRAIVRSRYANRHELNFLGEDYAQLKAEVASAGGNVQPIKVRRTAGDVGSETYELVFGHRRHQACLDLGLPVLAVIDNLDDRALFVEMDRENRSRKDLSAWEQGVMYQRALDEGLFPSNRKLAEAVGVDLGNLGRALMLARLPAEVIAAFTSPLDLQFRWAKQLTDAVSHDRDGVIRRAQALVAAKERLTGKAVLEKLLREELVSEARGGLYGTTPPASGLQLERKGKPVGSVQLDDRGAITIQIQAGLVPAERLNEVAERLNNFLSTLDDEN